MLIFLNALCIVLVFFIGADVFSLADEIAYCRIKDIDILKRKYSTCRECGHRLRIKDTFPVVSRFINKGKCRFCDAEFSKRGFYTEVSGGFFAVLIYVLLYFVFKLPIFHAAAIMIAAVIAGMLILAYIYTPRLIWDEKLVDEFKEGREEKDNKIKKQKAEKQDDKENDDIALIEYNGKYKNKEE